MKLETLLAATDFSVDGNHAVHRAARLASTHGARLHILHVVHGDGCRSLRDWFSPTIDIDLKVAQARAALRRVAVEISGAYDVAPMVEVAVGAPFESLLRAAERADLLVIGQRGRRRYRGLLVGGTADRLTRLCTRPVLVVRTPAVRAYRRVLVPVDFSASSDTAARLAARIRRDASLQIFHAIDSQREAVLRDADVPEHVIRESRLKEESDIRARLHRRIAGLGLDTTHISFATAHGGAVRSTLRQVQRYGADLIVSGKRDRSFVGGFVLGSFSSRLMSQAGCDTLIVPVPRERAQPLAAATAAPQPRSERAYEGSPAARHEVGQHAASSLGNWMHHTPRFAHRRSS